MAQTKQQQIPTFNVARLTNSAHKQFHDEIQERLQQLEGKNPQLDELVRRYGEALARENGARKIARKSFLTEKKDRANAVCGQIVGMMRATVSYVMKTTDEEEERTAARTVSHYIRQSGLSYERKYIHRLSLYNTLVRGLRRDYAREVERLGISHLVDRLEREATAMQEAIAQRQQETMSIPRQALLKARREVDECYAAVVCALNFLAMFETETAAREAADFCIGQIRRYRTTLSARTRRETQEQAAEAETQPINDNKDNKNINDNRIINDNSDNKDNINNIDNIENTRRPREELSPAV